MTRHELRQRAARAERRRWKRNIPFERAKRWWGYYGDFFAERNHRRLYRWVVYHRNYMEWWDRYYLEG